MQALHFIRTFVLVASTFVTIGVCHAQATEPRIALVIGNGAYPKGPLATTPNDAGLVAQTLQAAGFDVVGARDLDLATLRSSIGEFLEKAKASGPETVAVVYYAGYGLQFANENYLVPIDATLARDSDVPAQAIGIDELIKPLSGIPLKASILILDAGRANEFAKGGQPLAGGLALMQPSAGMLIAFNAAPGTIAPVAAEGYSPYATALSEMIKEGGLPLNDLFERVRLRAAALTNGAEIAWNVSRATNPFLFFERTSDAPPDTTDKLADLTNKPMRDFNANDAFLAALARDSMRGYLDFLAVYPDDPLAKRVRAIIAARREASNWRQSALADTPDAYWSYLRRYSHGPHAYDARRRLAALSALLDPPQTFVDLAYDLPPPPPDEIVYLGSPYVYFADPIYDLPPPPPVPVFFLPPPPVYFLDFPPPPPPLVAFMLPVPVYFPVPYWVKHPINVHPPVNMISVNIHNKVVFNPKNNSVIVTDPKGQILPTIPNNPPPGTPPDDGKHYMDTHPAGNTAAGNTAAGTTAVGAAALAVALPAAAAIKAKLPVKPVALPGQPGTPSNALNPALPVPANRLNATVPATGPAVKPVLPNAIPAEPAHPGTPVLNPPVQPVQPTQPAGLPGGHVLPGQPGQPALPNAGTPGVTPQIRANVPVQPVQQVKPADLQNKVLPSTQPVQPVQPVVGHPPVNVPAAQMQPQPNVLQQQREQAAKQQAEQGAQRQQAQQAAQQQKAKQIAQQRAMQQQAAQQRALQAAQQRAQAQQQRAQRMSQQRAAQQQRAQQMAQQRAAQQQAAQQRAQAQQRGRQQCGKPGQPRCR